jgi:Ni/Fe-hydrogenase 1 B-type cytochrome subunit
MSTIADPHSAPVPDPRSAPAPREQIYVWELPVRVTHWLIFFSFLILSATGYYIGHPFIGVPGPAANGYFVMGTARAIHLYTAIVFSLAVLVRIYWMFVGNGYARLSQFIPLTRARLRNVGDTLSYFCFIRRDLDTYPGHDALAAATYGLIFLIYLLLIATGLTLYTVYAPVNSPFQFFRFLIPVFGGLPVARLIHVICMWVVLIFAVIHIYSVWMFSTFQRFGIADSIFSGYKFVPKRNADAS